MEWVIAFTIVGLYAAQTFLVCSEYLKPTPTTRRGGFSRRSYWERRITPRQAEMVQRHLDEYRNRYSTGEKVNWKEEGF